MYRIPADYHWKQKVKAYQAQFRKKVPQWVLILAMDDATKLLSSCLALHYCLPSEVLVAGEVLEGRCGLWTAHPNPWDRAVKPSQQSNNIKK
ncbi:hypothetical protein ICN17_06950 [Polynucleobacter sp. 73C-SIWE]|uniref:hypothetical protein n=1 Tax=Polynucleobacter sp. 73C-SIWE TaxID=2689098 RepID=UPI001C0D3E07|nr:hypothetical protein [Polynucleobacter sp. 73C-SIWE]MBU3579742.1 hypothetical protein [Polynucleobacter sp. 73C-SIWE]